MTAADAADALRDAAEQLVLARACGAEREARINDGELRACAVELAVAVLRTVVTAPPPEVEAGIEYAIIMLETYAAGSRPGSGEAG